MKSKIEAIAEKYRAKTKGQIQGKLGAEWQSIKIDRAEPEQKRGRLPDESFVKNFDKTILCFPVKLALAPQMAWAVREMLKKEKIKPRFKQSKIQELPKAKLKEPFWETLF